MILNKIDKKITQMKKIVVNKPKNVISINDLVERSVIGYMTTSSRNPNQKVLMLGYRLGSDVGFTFINTFDYTCGLTVKANNPKEAIELITAKYSGLNVEDFVFFDSIQEAMKFVVKNNASLDA